MTLSFFACHFFDIPKPKVENQTKSSAHNVIENLDNVKYSFTRKEYLDELNKFASKHSEIFSSPTYNGVIKHEKTLMFLLRRPSLNCFGKKDIYNQYNSKGNACELELFGHSNGLISAALNSLHNNKTIDNGGYTSEFIKLPGFKLDKDTGRARLNGMLIVVGHLSFQTIVFDNIDIQFEIDNNNFFKVTSAKSASSSGDLIYTNYGGHSSNYYQRHVYHVNSTSSNQIIGQFLWETLSNNIDAAKELFII